MKTESVLLAIDNLSSSSSLFQYFLNKIKTFLNEVNKFHVLWSSIQFIYCIPKQNINSVNLIEYFFS